MLIKPHTFREGEGEKPPAATPAPAPAAPAAPAAPVPPATPAPELSHRELVEARVEIRQATKAITDAMAKLTPAPPPDPKDPKAGNDLMAKMQQQSVDLAFQAAALEADIKGEPREALKLMWKGAGSPTEGLGDWIEKHKKFVTPAAPAAAPAAPSPSPSHPTPPAPVAPDGDGGLTALHPASWPQAARDKLTYPDYLKACEAWEARQNAGGAGRVSARAYQTASVNYGKGLRPTK